MADLESDAASLFIRAVLDFLNYQSVKKNDTSFFQKHLEPDEVIKWEARPSLFLILSGDMTIRDVVLNIVVALFDIQIALAVIFIPVLLVGAIFYFLPVWGKIIGLLIMILIMTMKFKRIRNTRYAYSNKSCLLYTSPSPRDRQKSRMPSSA